jgi:hypothetical protein
MRFGVLMLTHSSASLSLGSHVLSTDAMTISTEFHILGAEPQTTPIHAGLKMQQHHTVE